MFNTPDLLYLAVNLSVNQLRQEIRIAENRATVASIFEGTAYQKDIDLFPWLDYAEACRLTIEAIKAKPQKAMPTTNHRFNINEIKERLDIVNVIANYTELKIAGKNFKGNCPIHGEKHPSLTVYPDNQSWHCYGCNQGGDAFSFIQQIENTDFRGAAAILERL